MIKLTPKRIKNLCIGASFLATGGGFPVGAKLFKMNELYLKFNLRIVRPGELSDKDFVCAVSGIGSAADIDNLNVAPSLKLGIKKIEEITGARICAIVPGELGIENIIFEIAGILDLPVLDGDTAGRRAVPEMTQDTFFIADKSILPVVLASLDGDVLVIDKPGQDLFVEKIAREMAVSSKSKNVLLFSHVRPVGFIKNIIALNSLSKSISVGRSLASCDLQKVERKLKQLLGAEVIGAGYVTSVNQKNEGGFLVKTVKIKSRNAIFTLQIKNEVLAVLEGGKIVSIIPDSICLLDADTFLPVHSSEIKLGKNIILFEVPAIAQWKTERGFNLFGPQYLRGLFRL